MLYTSIFWNPQKWEGKKKTLKIKFHKQQTLWQSRPGPLDSHWRLERAQEVNMLTQKQHGGGFARAVEKGGASSLTLGWCTDGMLGSHRAGRVCDRLATEETRDAGQITILRRHGGNTGFQNLKKQSQLSSGEARSTEEQTANSDTLKSQRPLRETERNLKLNSAEQSKSWFKPNEQGWHTRRTSWGPVFVRVMWRSRTYEKKKNICEIYENDLRRTNQLIQQRLAVNRKSTIKSSCAGHGAGCLISLQWTLESQRSRF